VAGSSEIFNTIVENGKWHTGVILWYFWHMWTVISSDFIIYISSNLELRDVEVYRI